MIYSVVLSVITYGRYLLGNEGINLFMVLIYIILYICFTVETFIK